MTNANLSQSVSVGGPVAVQNLAKGLGIPLAALDKLDANESPYGPPPSAIAALAQLAAEPTSLVGIGRYPDSTAAELRDALVTYTGIPATQIVVGNGSDELLHLLMYALLAPGDEVVVAEPTFETYSQMSRHVGASVVDAGTNDDFSVSPDRIIRAMGPRTRLVVLCSPNNPTGTPLARETLLAILDAARRNSGTAGTSPLVVVDEAYYEIGSLSGDPDAWSAAEALSSGQYVAVFRTFSKIFGLAGLRAGYALLPEELASAVRARKQLFNANVVGLTLARAALEDLSWLAERARWIVAERQRFADELATIPGVRVYPSAANFLLVELPGGAERRDAVRGALFDRGILVRRPSGERVAACLRITVGTPEQDDRLLDALREVLGASVAP